ncbi:hypothetical protein CEXT_609761 [Caerostris extrusa]|uniref:Uncharacterized protein n=1 Tax=Caerostris extrusa TaxID=172846 RepID=A0AAV4RIJ5_CAEEX|nr:hypothetical protein CEXT_609761 [Caerostris extrusa]
MRNEPNSRTRKQHLAQLKEGELENPFIGGTKLPRQTHSESSESPLLSSNGVKGERVDLSNKLAFRSAEIVETEEWRWTRICRQGKVGMEARVILTALSTSPKRGGGFLLSF